MGVFVWWIGEGQVDVGGLERLRATVALEFGRPVEIWRGRERPDGTLDPKRNQHSSRSVLAWLRAQHVAASSRVIGLTDVDLFIPVLTFVFGEAQLNGTAAIVSTHRLAQGVDADGALGRLTKECIHELGHTFGLVHCGTPGCVMARSPSVRAVDEKGARLCRDCRERYEDIRQGERYELLENENSRR